MKTILFMLLFSIQASANFICPFEWYAKKQDDNSFSLFKASPGLSIPTGFALMELDNSCNPYRVMSALKLEDGVWVLDHSLLAAAQAAWDGQDHSAFVLP